MRQIPVPQYAHALAENRTQTLMSILNFGEKQKRHHQAHSYQIDMKRKGINLALATICFYDRLYSHHT